MTTSVTKDFICKNGTIELPGSLDHQLLDSGYHGRA